MPTKKNSKKVAKKPTKALSKRPTKRPKVKDRRASASPAGDEARPVPRGYATRARPLLAGPGARVVGGTRTEPSRRDVARRFYEVTNASNKVRGPASAGQSKRETKRLEDILENRPPHRAHPVRSDYFGTAEHRAIAEYLDDLLNGRPSKFKLGSKADQSHVLFFAPVPTTGPGSAPVKLGPEAARSADANWRDAVQAEVSEVFNFYDPTRELEVRAGIALHYGEISALAGDYYESPDSLAAEITPAVAEAIRGVTPEHDGTFLLTVHRGLFKYVDLATRNADHFAPRSWIRYAFHHGQALRIAIEHGDLEAALVRNAFADHFLEDAFASGHLRVPRSISESFRKRAVSGLGAMKGHDEDNKRGLWMQNGRGFLWRGYGDDRIAVNKVHATLVAHALGTSIQRVYAAYRLRGADASALVEKIAAWQAPNIPAATPSDPNKVLPDWLGAFPAGTAEGGGRLAKLRDIRELIPVALPSKATWRKGELCNPPSHDEGGPGNVDWEPYFEIAP
jgi:hypothetical protein